MELTKEQALDLVNGDLEGYDTLETRTTGNSRWSIHELVVFRSPDGNVYGLRYSKGATEYQDEQPFEYASGPIKCQEYELVSLPSYQLKGVKV